MTTSNYLRNTLFWFLLLQCSVISVSIAAGSVLLALSLVTLLAIIGTERKWLSYKTPLDYAFAAYIIIELVTAVTSVDTLAALKNSKRLLLIGIVYGVLVSFSSKEKISFSVKLITGIVAAQSLLEVILFFHYGYDRLYFFQHYMTTGGLKMIACLITVPFILSNEVEKKERIFYLVSFALAFVALIFTNTRSAWLGFIAGLIVISALQFRKLFVILVVLIAAFFIFAPERQIERAKSIVDPTHPNNEGRLLMWSTGLRMWQDKPLLGFGDIDLYSSYSHYRTPTDAEPAGHLHNNYIHLLVTTGVVGLCVVLFLFYKVLQTEYRIFSRNRSDILTRNIALAGLSVFCGFLVNGIFEWNFGDHEIMVFIWFSAGLCLAANKTNQQ